MSDENTGGMESAPAEVTESVDTSTPELQLPEGELEAALENAPAEKTYTIKIDGQEIQVTEEELLSGYQSTKAAQQRFNEAARMRKQAEEFVRIAKTDPRKLLSHPDIGVDLKTFANDILAEMLEEEIMSPQEKELRDTKRRLAEYEEEKRRIEEANKQSELEKYSQIYEQEYTDGIVSALDTSGLPRTESTVKKMASYMLLALEKGLDVKPKDVVEFVKRDYINEVNSLFGAADSEVLLNLLGDNISTKVVKGHLARVKSKNPAPKITELTKPANPQMQQPQGIKRATSREEWLKTISERAKGK